MLYALLNANAPQFLAEFLLRLAVRLFPMVWGCCVLLLGGGLAVAQTLAVGSGVQSQPAHRMRARRFLAGRAAVATSAARSLDAARQQHAALVAARPALSSLNAAWQSIGPLTVASQSYGNVSGRVSAIAVDPADASGNTVYVGTTGGGVWKSTNAAGPAASIGFAPLTDTLPVFSANAGSAATASLSIGAVSVGQYAGQSIVLAGTGDTNDATDSYYGSGILRSVDGGVTWTLAQGSKDGVAGNHSFVGLGFAGFAWSSNTSGLVVAAVGDAAEGELVNAVDATNSVKGLYYSSDAGVTWQMAVIEDGSQIVQTPRPTGGNLGGNAATAVVWNPLRQRFYAAVRYHGYYESTDGMTWTRLAQQPGAGLTITACPTNPGLIGNASCPDLSRRTRGAGDDGRYLRAHHRREQSGPGAVAGCMRRIGRRLRQCRKLCYAVGFGSSGDRQRKHRDRAGRLQPFAGGGSLWLRYESFCGNRGLVSLHAVHWLRVAEHDQCSEWLCGSGAGRSSATCGHRVAGRPAIRGQRWRVVAFNRRRGRDRVTVLGDGRKPLSEFEWQPGIAGRGGDLRAASDRPSNSAGRTWCQRHSRNHFRYNGRMGAACSRRGRHGCNRCDRSAELVHVDGCGSEYSPVQQRRCMYGGGFCRRGDDWPGSGERRSVGDRCALVAGPRADAGDGDRHLPRLAWACGQWSLVVAGQCDQPHVRWAAERYLFRNESRGAVAGCGGSGEQRDQRTERRIAGDLCGTGWCGGRRRQPGWACVRNICCRDCGQHDGVERSGSLAGGRRRCGLRRVQSGGASMCRPS